jgi:hypothetical protein
MTLRRTEHGVITITEPDKPVIEAATLCCCHCGKHWVPQPGSGRIRGFCQNCCGPVCGPGCADCVPVEQYLENIEQGRPENYKPIIVSPGWTD